MRAIMRLVFISILLIIMSVSIFGCGKKRSTSNQNGTNTTTGIDPSNNPYFDENITLPPIDDGDDDDGTTGLNPYSFEFDVVGGSSSYTTPAITTDNILKVKVRVGSNLGLCSGNYTSQYAQELKVTVAVNGQEIVPTYTVDNWTYGRVSDGDSNVIDFSAALTPGTPVSITVKEAYYDFYCLYPYYNPLYMSYPGCRKKVLDPVSNPQVNGHCWSGTLIVQTNSTTEI